MALSNSRLTSILDSAAELFFLRGYEGTSMQAVADATGLHKSSLYHHVHGKAELLVTICTGALDALFASLDEALDASAMPGERVVAAFDGAARVALTDVRGTSIVLHLSPEVAPVESIWQRRRDYDRRFAELIRAAQDSGEVRSDIEALLLTRLVLGMINWLVEWYRPDQGHYHRDEVRRSLTGFIRQGILPPGAWAAETGRQ